MAPAARVRLAAIALALALPLGRPRAVAPPSGYGPEPAATPSALEARSLDAVRARLRPAPRSSAALVLAARALAARAAAGVPEPIAPPAVRSALARAGAADPPPVAVLVTTEVDDVPAAIARALPRPGATHVGAGAVERDGTAFVVLLLSERRARLDPFPAQVGNGSRAVLSGALLPPLTRPRVWVTRPSGDVLEAGGASGSTFQVPLEFAAEGRHVVEVIGEGEAGPEVALLLTVAVGGASLDAPKRPRPAPEPADAATSEAGVLRALNAARARRGLPPVAAAADVAEVARRHAEAMAAAGRVAHVLPGSREAGSRLQRAGVAFRRAHENVARGGTALEAHDAVEDSPAHLANVLRPGATRAGVGIARARLPSGEPAVYLAELLVEPPDDGAASPLTPDARVREALWRERARLGAAPLTADPALDALAREAASAMRSRDETDPDGLAERALALRRELAAVDVFVAGGPDDAARSSNVRDPRFSRVGVGVAAGDSRRYGKARLFIAVLYTD